MADLISVIVPVYGVEQYLDQCVDSILRQTHSNLEVILVDDGSPDACGEMCEGYARRDTRVKVIHKENGGLSDARNAGLDMAQGDYIGFVDSDDWVAPDMFEYLLQGARGMGEGVACCEVISAQTWKLKYKVLHQDSVYDSLTALEDLFFDRRENYAWNKLYRADLWNGIRFPKGLNFEDLATVYKTFEGAGQVAYLREAKYYYRLRSDSISGTKDFAFRRDIALAVIARYWDVAPRLPKFKPALFRRVRNWYVHELCRDFRDHPENDPLSYQLLDILAPFVAETKDDIADALQFEDLERKKLDAFAKGTCEGCLESLKLHDLMWKKRNRKANIRKLLHL